MNFDLLNIIPLVIGIVAFIFSMFLLRKLFKRFLAEDEYAKFKRSRINIFIPLLIGLIIIFILYIFYQEHAGKNYQSLLEPVTSWMLQHGVAILLVIIIVLILNKLLSVIIPPTIRNFTSMRSKQDSAQIEIDKRSGMLSSFLIHIGQAIIIIIAIFVVLSQCGIDITPMLAGAGVVGLAVGLGAQKFTGDVINVNSQVN